MKFSYPSGSKPLQGYTIKRGIGVGGFGEVYFAISDAGKEIALKKIQRNLDIELRGVRQCLNLNHVNLISLWDIKTNRRGESWVVMEYVPGVSLRDVIEAFPNGMPESEIKKWFAATASGVAYLHKHGIVHRDLKPGNIFRDDDQHIVKIGDYGLSKFIACNRRSGHTQAVGTFHYMAPEIGKGEYGKEIDIYALGILLFEMLTGDVPFNGESSQEIIMKHLTANVPLEKVPPAFHRVVLKSLNKDPQYRYSSVQEMVKELPWRDLATNSETITAQYALGHPSLMPSEGCDSEPPVSHGKAKIAPIFVSGHALEILRENTVFGEAATSSRPVGSSRESEPEFRRNPTAHKSTAPHQNAAGARPKKSFATQAGTNSVDPKQTLRDNEIESSDDANQSATVVLTGNISTGHQPRRSDNYGTTSGQASLSSAPARRLIQWWSHGPVAMFLKLVVVAMVMALIFNTPAMLPQLAFAIGLFYLINYARRHGVFSGNTATRFTTDVATPDFPAHDRRDKKIISNFGIDLKQLTVIRLWLNDRPWQERLTDLIGSFLVAALACLVLNLIPFSMAASPAAGPDTTRLSESILEFWGRYALAASVSISACWVILLGGKVFELSHGEAWLRRGAMVVKGLGIGIIGWTAADYFGITLGLTPSVPRLGAFRSGGAEFADFQIKGIPVITAYLLFFGGLFGALRWWHQVDPARRTRLSLASVGLCFVWAIVFSHVLGLPTGDAGMLAIAVATSLQLAAPWIGEKERKRVVAEKLR